MKTLWLLTFSIVMLFGCNGSEMGQSKEPDMVNEQIGLKESIGDAAYSFEFTTAEKEKGRSDGTFQATDTVGHGTGPGSTTDRPVKTPDKIIKSGNMKIEVEEYAKAMQQIADKVKAAQGYISNQNEHRSDYQITNILTIRVPSENFDRLISGIGEGAKKLVSKNVNMHDVSEEYTDVAARLKTKREVELRYLDILKSAKTIKDILEVEDHLRTIREEIESATARLKYMDDRVSYSTISLEVYQEIAYTAPAALQAGFGHKLLSALTSGWNGLLAFVIGLVHVWPFMLVITLVIVLLYRKWKRRMARV